MRRLGIVLVLATMVGAASVAVAQGPGPSGDVVIANAYASVDALTGGPLASRLGAPLVTTRVDDVPEETARQVDALRPSRVILLGGPVVISSEVEAYFRDLPWDPNVVRLGGADRFATSELIANFLAEQPLPDAGSLSGASLDDLVTDDDLDSLLGASSAPVEQVLPMPQDDDDGQAGPWVRTGPMRTRLVCEPDVGGLPEIQSYVDVQWVGDGHGEQSPFSQAFAYVNGSTPSDIQTAIAGMIGTDGDHVIEAAADGWISINLTTSGSCHAVWTVKTRNLPTSSG